VACESCKGCAPDHIRALIKVLENGAGVDPLTVKLDLPPNARVYYIKLRSETMNEAIVLQLQDSATAAGFGDDLEANLPGLVWPANASVTVPPMASGTLRLFYGECQCG